MDHHKKFLEALGLPTEGLVPLRQGEPSEPIDEEKIKGFYRNKLNSQDALNVSYLISHEQAWFDASIQVLFSLSRDNNTQSDECERTQESE